MKVKVRGGSKQTFGDDRLYEGGVALMASGWLIGSGSGVHQSWQGKGGRREYRG